MDSKDTLPKFLVQVKNRYATEFRPSDNPGETIATAEAEIAEGPREYLVFPWTAVLRCYLGSPTPLSLHVDNGTPYDPKPIRNAEEL